MRARHSAGLLCVCIASGARESARIIRAHETE